MSGRGGEESSKESSGVTSEENKRRKIEPGTHNNCL